MARLTAAGKLACIIVFAGVVGGGYYYAKTNGLLTRAKAPEAVAEQSVDVAPAPAPAPVEQEPVQQAAPAPAPVDTTATAPAPAPSQDASSNRGMQFLLNQGKN
jgi:hypothetical protein